MHDAMLGELAKLRKTVNPLPDTQRYHDGTWENGVARMYYDAHYQLGLHFLVHALGIASGFNPETLPTFLKSLRRSDNLLSEVMRRAIKMGAADRALSATHRDVMKNTLLVKMRYAGALDAALRKKEAGDPSVWQGIDEESRAPTEEERDAADRSASATCDAFLTYAPDDKDHQVFRDWHSAATRRIAQRLTRLGRPPRTPQQARPCWQTRACGRRSRPRPSSGCPSGAAGHTARTSRA